MKPDKSHLTCVVVLNQLEDPAVQERVRNLAMNLKTTKKLAMPVEVAFCNVNFSKENGLLRPNMKIDRKRIAALFGGPAHLLFVLQCHSILMSGSKKIRRG